MKPITTRQQQTLDFIKKYISENGYSPSMREIGDGIDSLSTSTILAIVEKLEDKGFITRQHNVPRSIRIVGQDPRDQTIADLIEALDLINNICYGKVKHINHHARILHILEVSEEAIQKAREAN